MKILLKLADGRTVTLSKIDTKCYVDSETQEGCDVEDMTEITLRSYLDDNIFFHIEEDDFTYFPSSVVALMINA